MLDRALDQPGIGPGAIGRGRCEQRCVDRARRRTDDARAEHAGVGHTPQRRPAESQGCEPNPRCPPQRRSDSGDIGLGTARQRVEALDQRVGDSGGFDRRARAHRQHHSPVARPHLALLQ